MQFISVTNVNPPAGHYSAATKAGNLLCISGQLPLNPFTGEKCTGGVIEQTLQVLQNIDTVLQAAGANKQDIIKTTVYVTDIALWDTINAVYAKYFGEHKPARSVVPTKDLHYGFLVEIEAMAYLRGE